MSFARLISLFETAEVMSLVAALFVFNLSITVVEAIADALRSRPRRWRDTGANTLTFFANQLLERTFVGSVGLIALMTVHQVAPVRLPMNGWTWALALLAADFTYYWMHRIEHEHRILWANHSVHHSSEDYNLTVAFRLSVVEPLIEWLFLVPMILFGFSPFQALVGLILVAQYQSWIHTERIGRLGWLDRVLNTPSVHRVHHGSNPQYLDKNYGGILMLWDHLFGTYEPEVEPVVYGLTKNLGTNDPIRIHFLEYLHIWRDARRCKRLPDALRVVFGGLTWRPDDFEADPERPDPPAAA